MPGTQQDNNSNLNSDPPESAAEYLRLALARLSKIGLPVNPVNYSLMYFYVAGKDLDLNERIDELLKGEDAKWDDGQAKDLFTHFICRCNHNEYKELREELLMTVAQVLGSVIDLTGKAEESNKLLEKHMVRLAATNSPQEILRIAADIISDTRDFMEKSRQFENNLIETTNEISLLKDELDEARRMATTDALTGLHNRRGFDQALSDLIEFSQEAEEEFCLLIVDIDRFKNVNDKHGHLVGDKVLVGISKLLHQHMRGNDHLSRFGGEEFAVLLKDTPITGAFTVAENLRKSVERLRLKHVKSGVELDQVTISIGMSCYRKSESISDFIQRCDKALYRAKSLGRNRTVIAD